MQRASTAPTAPWIQIQVDFKECQRRNEDQDNKDNILEPLGLIRWSVKC